MVTRVLVLYSRSLLAAGVQSRLKRMDGVEVMDGADSGRRNPLEWIRSVCPHVVIIDEDDPGINCGELIPQILDEDPAIRLVRISTAGERVHIYDKRVLSVSNVGGLLEAIGENTR